MIKMGNIFSDCELINHKKLDYINYGKCSDMPKFWNFNASKFKTNNLPTLFIGWKALENIFPINILEKKLPNNMFWEFSPEEDIIQYTNSLESFIKEVPSLYIKRCPYINADLFNHKIFKSDDLEWKLSKIKNGDLYVYKNDMAYYNTQNNTIYGFKLPIYNAVLGDGLALKTLKESSEKVIEDDGELFQRYYKMFPDFPLLKRSMVVFAFS